MTEKNGKKMVKDEVNIVLFNILPILYVVFITTVVVLFVSNRVYFNYISNNSLYVFLFLGFLIVNAHMYVDKIIVDYPDTPDYISIKNKLKANGAFIVFICTLIIIYYIVKYIMRYRENRNQNIINNPYINIQPGLPGYARVAEI